MNKTPTRIQRHASVFTYCFGFTCLLFSPMTAIANDIVIDGQFDDWKQPMQRCVDAKGDATAAFDLSFVEVSTVGTQLFLHFDIGQSLNLQSGRRTEGTLQLKVNLNDERTLIVDFRERNAYLEDQPEERIVWTSLRMVSQPTYASDEVEMRLDLAAVGAKIGDQISIQFDGSDSLEQALELKLQGSSKSQDRSIQRSHAGDFRVVSFNTMNQGIADESRQPMFRRLLSAMDADVICFQEERDENRFSDSVSHVLPQQTDEKWSTHWANGAAIVTRHSLTALPLEMTAGAAAAVTSSRDETWIVLSIHFKCCGYAGSPEDKLRVTQATEIVEQLQRVRAGEFGQQFASAPVIIVGDYNLVGSREPLQVLADAGFVDHPLIGLHDRSAATWRGRPDESFWPGRLDLVTFQKDHAVPHNSFSLDTSLLSDAELQRMGLQMEDSSVSDHLMVVVDFAQGDGSN